MHSKENERKIDRLSNGFYAFIKNVSVIYSQIYNIYVETSTNCIISILLKNKI